MDDIGNRIRKLRLERKLSQEQLAKLIGIKQGSLTQLETGKSKTPASTTLTRLAQVFGVDPEWLMTGKGPQHVLSDEESDLLVIFRALSSAGRQYVLSRAQAIQDNELDGAPNTPMRRATDVKRPGEKPDGH